MDLKMEITTSCTLGGVRKLAALTREALAQLVPDETIHALEIVVVESCTNLVQHGARGRPDLPLTLSLDLKGEELEVAIVDECPPFDPRRFQRCRFGSAALRELPTRGMGLTLIHDVMDSVAYEARDGCNRTRFRKRVPRLPASDPLPAAAAEREGR